MKLTPHVIPAKDVKSFMLAGKALLTFQSSASGEHFTYSIDKAVDKEIWFVKILTNAASADGYAYIGCLYEARGKVAFKLPANPKISEDALSVIVFKWVVNHLDKHEVLAKMIIRHEGYCCKCGRTLTTPESIERGIGPVCAGLMAKEAAKKQRHNPAIEYGGYLLGGITQYGS